MEDKKIPLRIIIITIVVVCAVGLWCCISDCFNKGHGTADDVDTDIKRLGEQQRKTVEAINRAGDGLDSGIERIDNIKKEINNAEFSAAAIEDRITHSEERLIECKRLIDSSQSRITEYRRRLQSSTEEE